MFSSHELAPNLFIFRYSNLKFKLHHDIKKIITCIFLASTTYKEVNFTDIKIFFFASAWTAPLYRAKERARRGNLSSGSEYSISRAPLLLHRRLKVEKYCIR